MKATNRSPKSSVPDLPRKKRRLILLVDDSRAQRRMLTIQLNRAGYDVVEAATGQDALTICKRMQPDFILSDWMMADMEGPQFCRAFRKLPREGYGYFVLLTSKTNKADIAYGLEAGADDFLTKPISGAELLARLTAGERVLHFEEDLRASNAVLKKTLEQLHAAQDEMARDLAEARKLQQGLVRERSARLGNFDLSLLLRPSGQIGGDLVGFFHINDERTGIFAIDVSGHGVAAALLAAQLSTHLSGSAAHNVALEAAQKGEQAARPAALARFFNNMLLEEMKADTYFTMIYADLNHRTGRVNLVQAGHPHPALQHKDGTVRFLGTGGMPIGVFANPEFDEFWVDLAPGDRLLIASDGITETVNPNGQLLGETGLEAIMRTNAFVHGHNFLKSMSWSISEYAKGKRGDDVSAVLIEHLGDAGPIPFVPVH